MSFPDFEQSRTKGMPAYTLLFRYGPAIDAVVGITNADREIIHAMGTFKPEPVNVGSIVSSGTLDKSNLEVMVKSTNQIAEQFKSFAPSAVVGLTIFQGHVGNPTNDWPVIWVGRILNAMFEGPACRFSCQSVYTSLQRTILRRPYIRQCPLVLYGADGCRASLGAASAAFTPESVDDFSITMPEDWRTPALASRYLGGLVFWNGPSGQEVRTIVHIADDRILTLSGPTYGINGGEAVTIAFGCSHTLELVDATEPGGPVKQRLAGDCIDVHHNINNFGGQLWMPEENPVDGSRNVFY